MISFGISGFGDFGFGIALTVFILGEAPCRHLSLGSSFPLTSLCNPLLLPCPFSGDAVQGCDYSVFYLLSVEAITWLAVAFSALQSRPKVSVKFPFLVRVWWPVSFFLCLYIGYVYNRGFLDKSAQLNSHVVVNYVAAPTLTFLSHASICGILGINVYRGNSDIQEPLLAEEEEAGCLEVTHYSEVGLFSLVILSWLNPLLSTGAKRPVELRDVPLLAPKDRSKT